MHKYFHNSELAHCAAMHKVLTSVSAQIFWGVRDQCDALKMAITLLKKIYVVNDRCPFNGLFSRTMWVSQHQKG